MRLSVVLVSVSAIVSPVAAFAQQASFNANVLASVEFLAEARAGKGYGPSYYTQNLDYGSAKNVIKAGPSSPLTMCVAAVAETVIESLNRYSKTTDRIRFEDQLSSKSWNGWSPLDIRTHLWENEGTHSAGQAFERFGIGERLPFEALKPGDFLSFDRPSLKDPITGKWKGSGHSVVFLGFIDDKYDVLTSHSSKVSGFKYFSSQGNASTGGFGYRWAFFVKPSSPNVCTTTAKREDKPWDCARGGVIRSSIRGGRLWHPKQWQVAAAIAKLKEEASAKVRSAVTDRLQSELAALNDLPAVERAGKLNELRDLSGALTDFPGSPSYQGSTGFRDPSNLEFDLKSPAWQRVVDRAIDLELEKNVLVDASKFDGQTD